MTAYYNEIDPYAAQWLRNLIEAGHIAPGVVDERSISDIKPSELVGFTQCHFFAGIGVWSYALRRAGWSDERPIWTGSCPCQPFSTAGKGDGFDDERHLWPHFHWLIEQCAPSIVLGEQVASKDGLEWLDLVSTDLEGTGYAIGASDLCAAGFEGAHIRQRLYWVAHANHQHKRPASSDSSRTEYASRVSKTRRLEARMRGWSGIDWLLYTGERLRPIESGLYPLADASPIHMEQLRAYGNALDAETATQFCSAVIESLADAAAADRNNILR